MSGFEPFTIEFRAPTGPGSVAIEDDGKVCYAYLLDGAQEIVSDVWLYNRAATPDLPEWGNFANAPFANPKEYVASKLAFQPPSSSDAVNVRWISDAAGRSRVQVYIDRQLVAELATGMKPGLSILAAKDGPLARVLIPG